MQVDEWLEELQLSRTPKLEVIDGSPGRLGVTFVYSAETTGVSGPANGVWLDPELALPTLSLTDRRRVL